MERQIPGDVLLTLGYAGARSTHLLESGQNINLVSPSGCGTIPGYVFGCGQPNQPWAANPLNPATSIGNVFNIFDNGFSRYDSLQVKAETKSTKHGLYALLGYTFSKRLFGKLGITNFRIAGSAENLLTATSYRGLDPEKAGSRT